MKKARHNNGLLRRLGGLSAGALVAAMVALPAAPSSAAPAPTAPDLQYVNAVVDASLAHLKVTWTGWLVLTRDVDLWDGWYESAGVYGPYIVTTTCSGYVASADGAVVTAGHCVDAEGIAGGTGAILSAAVAELTSVPAEQAQAYAALAANANVEGIASDSPPDRTVKVTVPALSKKAHPASVQDVQPFEDGDVALLNVTGLVAPALPLADAQPASGVGVVAAGYSGAVSEIVDSETPPTFNEGSVSGTETVNGTPFTSISARTSPGMSGGPVVNMDGTVVGTVSWAPVGSNTSSDFMTTVGSIQSILAGNGVNNALGNAEQAYRDGLSYYFESRYHDAVAKFDEALALQPSWKMVTKFRQQAVANYPNDVAPPQANGGGDEGADGGGVPVWLYVAIGGGLVLLAGGVAGALLLRRRPKARPASAAPSMPPFPPPTAAPAGLPAQALTPPPPVRAEATATEHVFCPNCGTKHGAGVHYCEECGQPLFTPTVPAEQDVT
jgi:S1-C subfamily serine protease